MLAIFKYQDKNYEKPSKFTLLVVHNEVVISEYRKICNSALNVLLGKYNQHKTKLFVNVSKASELSSVTLDS